MGISPLKGRDAACARVFPFYSRENWIEGRAEDQLHEVAGWPGMRRVAGFPDLHPGRFGPVGAAFLADRVWPQLVGPDIGCGMALWRLDLPRHRLKLDRAERRLGVLDEGADLDEAAEALAGAGLAGRISAFGLGSIGGGNHFCEVQVVDQTTDAAAALGLATGDLCLLVHSGSRSRGQVIFDGLDQGWRHGFMPDQSEAQAYLALHDAAETWARVNRRLIAERAAEALGSGLSLVCDSVHNHVRQTPEGWLHRKGAAAPDRGLVPLAGSRDAASFLLQVTDLVPEALGSVSHGAGRRYDRSSMHGRIRKERSTLAALTRTRFGGRVICADPDLLLEESGQAYKASESVLQDLLQFDLARCLARLHPLLTFKTAARRGGEVNDRV